MTFGLPQSSAARQALLAASLMMAWQVAAKATRDTLFLANFPTSAVPAAMGASAVFSILIAVLTARMMRSTGPGRVIPYAYLAGALLHGVEYLLLPQFPRVIGVAVYLHVMSLGPVLLSGFWALANERFDAREARRRFGQITAFGTIGAVAGGLLGERVSSLASPASLLILLLVLQALCGTTLFRFAPPRSSESPTESQSIPDVISGAPYLVGLVCFVLLTSMSAAMLDYLFKVTAAVNFTTGPELGRFFSLFYAVTSAITFAVQAVVSRLWMKRFGPGGTVAVLPIAVTGASLLSLAFPGSVGIILARGLEQLLRGSLYRSGYELFYTPMPADEKRTTKPVIDIGVDRLGDGLAAAVISFVMHFEAPITTRLVLGFAAIIASGAAWLALRLDKAYVKVLERGLANQAVTIMPDEAEDILTKTVALQSIAFMPGALGSTMVQKTSVVVETAHIPAEVADPILRRMADLRSGNTGRIRSALQQPVDGVLLPQVIELLADDQVARRVHELLMESGPKATGMLLDTLANQSVPMKVRRRIPRILAATGGKVAWEGLLAQLTDQNFDIRHRCGRALNKIQQRHAECRADHDMIVDIVSRELASHKPMASGSSIRRATSSSETSNLPPDQASLRVNHISNLLALVLPPQSIGLAFRALLTDDRKLRATAIEYLDSVLPESLRDQIAAVFERPAQARPAVKSDEALSQLMQASPTIMAKLAELGVKEDRETP